MQRVFLSYNANDFRFVVEVAQHLKRGMEVFHYLDSQTERHDIFIDKLNKEIQKATVFVFFIGNVMGKYQKDEINSVIQREPRPKTIVIILNDAPIQVIINSYFLLLPPDDIFSLKPPIGSREAIYTAKRIYDKLGLRWVSRDGLPWDPHLFSYEKDIIHFFKEKSSLGEDLFKNPNPSVHQLEIMRKLLDGCPIEWPEVERWEKALENLSEHPNIDHWRRHPYKSKFHDIKFRPPENKVVAAALTTYHGKGCDLEPNECLIVQKFCFPEAGPREDLFFPPRWDSDNLKVAILVSGGIAPGINAVIDGIVQRHWKYALHHDQQHGLKIYGIKNGFLGLSTSKLDSFVHLVPHFISGDSSKQLVTSQHANEGGSILGTSRLHDLLQAAPQLSRDRALEDILGLLSNMGIDILYIIGGDGSMRAAHALWSISQSKADSRPLSVVAIPKTMDNDILWVWQAFGFLSAVEKAREVIEYMYTEIKSNPRLCIIQLFGSDSGFVVSHSVLASPTGCCDAALIPEVPFSMKKLAIVMKRNICRRRETIPRGLIVLAETAIPVDAMLFVSNQGKKPRIDIGLSEEEQEAIREFHALRRAKRRIQGQTNDALRSAGLKIVSRGLAQLLPQVPVNDCRGVDVKWKNLRIVINEPRHLLRSIAPSCSDIIMGQRLGMLAVDNAMAGYTDFMISQWLTEYVLVPLKLVTLGRKRIPPKGIFWRSVLDKTGQPEDMVTPRL